MSERRRRASRLLPRTVCSAAAFACEQPAAGYRVAIDPVFLAAAVPAEPHQLVLDVGCGAGAAMLCLAARVPHSRVVGLEMQRDLVRLAGDNVILNGLEARASVMIGDLAASAAAALAGGVRPRHGQPAIPPSEVTRSPTAGAGKSAATIEGRGRSRRLGALLARDGPLQGHASRLFTAPTGSTRCSAKSPGGPARSWCFRCGRARAGRRAASSFACASRSPLRRGSPLASYLHEPDGRLTAGAEGVLREGRGLDL